MEDNDWKQCDLGSKQTNNPNPFTWSPQHPERVLSNDDAGRSGGLVVLHAKAHWAWRCLTVHRALAPTDRATK